MKVYCVFKPEYNSYSDSEEQTLEAIFTTKELAQEFADFEIGQWEIEEWDLKDSPLPSTLRTQEKVKEGKIIITKDKGFKFTGK